MKILALDLSTKRSGWAFMDENNELKYGVVVQSSKDVEKRIAGMRDGILEVIKEYKPDIVVAEEVRPDGYNNHTGKVLNWLQGCIAIAAYEYDKNISLEFIGASSWRSEIGIQGYRIKRDAQKIKDIEYANEHYNLNLTLNQDDEADAIGILSARLKGLAPEKKERLKPIGSDESAF